MEAETIGRLVGWIGGIFGGLLGVCGGLLGTYLSIRNTNGPRERAFVVRACIACWLFVLGFVTAMFLIPGLHKHWLWLPYAIALCLGIHVFNSIQGRIRAEESGPAAKKAPL
jgi:hypothetical protein